MKHWYIYALRDPVSWDVRYIGKAMNPVRRLQAHVRTSAHEEHHNARWVRKLVLHGLRPLIETLEVGAGDGDSEAEIAWIAEYRRRGADLTNATDGGDGILNASPETRKKISAANMGHPVSPEHRQKVSSALKGRVFSAGTLSKMSAGQKGRKHTPETRAKMSASHTGVVQSGATRAKRSASVKATAARKKLEREAELAANPPPLVEKRPAKGWKHTDATRKKMSEAAKARGMPKFVPKRELGSKMSEASKNKLGAAISATAARKRAAKPPPPPRTYKFSEEARARMRTGQQARRAREKGEPPPTSDPTSSALPDPARICLVHERSLAAREAAPGVVRAA